MSQDEIEQTSPAGASASGGLHCGDNLEVLRQFVGDASVDLVYLDPPFNTARDYGLALRQNMQWVSQDDNPAVFKDTWEWDDAARHNWSETIKLVPALSGCLQGLRSILGDTPMLAYLSMMAPRLVEIRRVMKPTASIYLHCDPTASHYLRLLMDAVFGPENFLNEIVWRYRRWPRKGRRFQRMHDILLFYSRTETRERTFDPLYGLEQLAPSTLESFGTRRQVADFSSGHRKPSTSRERSPGPPLSDVWEVGLIAPVSKERVGYPTQKPEALLERVVLASSAGGQVVLDPFCGSGTALVVAHRLGRGWIGIDASPLAIEMAQRRLEHRFGIAPGATTTVATDRVAGPATRGRASATGVEPRQTALNLQGGGKPSRTTGPSRRCDR